MITEPVVNLSIVGATCILLAIYLIRFVSRYKHEYESHPLCTLVVLFSLLVVLLATFILPIDIFLVSYVKEPDGTFKSWATNATLTKIDTVVFNAYYCKYNLQVHTETINIALILTSIILLIALYGITVFSVFILIPFFHFYNEERENNPNHRLHNAIKYTFFSTFIMGTMLLLGASLHTSGFDPNEIFSRIFHLTETTRFRNAITIILTFITTAGFLNVAFYTASGIFSWPIGLLLGTSSVSNRLEVVNEAEIQLRTRINTLQAKLRLGQLGPRDRLQLLELEEQLRNLEREEAALATNSSSITYKLRCAIRPLQKIVGFLSGILSIVLVVSLILANLDRFLHGTGPKEGYVLLKPTMFNPISYICSKAQELTSVGPFPLLIITSFLLIATISGMRNLGLWFLFARIHRIKPGRTHPQALLFFCTSVMFAAMAFNLVIYSMSTEYVTFGGQNYITKGANGTTLVQPCTFQDYNESCVLSRASILLIRMMSQLWVFGAIFYWQSWMFVAVSLISFAAYLVRGKRSATHGLVTDENEVED